MTPRARATPAGPGRELTNFLRAPAKQEHDEEDRLLRDAFSPGERPARLQGLLHLPCPTTPS